MSDFKVGGESVQKRTFIFLMYLCLEVPAFGVSDHRLKIGVYRSFLSSYGPSQALAQAFEKKCQCHLEWVGLGHGAELLRKGVHAGVADVIMGFDKQAVLEFKKTASSPLKEKLDLSAGDSYLDESTFAGLRGYLLPYSIGVMTIIERRQKLYAPTVDNPKTLIGFLAQTNRNLFIQDPRTSSLGAGLLYWLQDGVGARDADSFLSRVKLLKQATLGVGKSWSSSYGLFLKGEADYAFSYLTSEAYHLGIEGRGSYRALTFDDPLPAHIEFAAILKSSKQKKLSKMFMDFLSSEAVQAYIAYRNVMLPFKGMFSGNKIDKRPFVLKPLSKDICSFEGLLNKSDLVSEQNACVRYVESIPIARTGQPVFFFPSGFSSDYKKYLGLWKRGMR